jgi:S1-C subfamily serine protease
MKLNITIASLLLLVATSCAPIFSRKKSVKFETKDKEAKVSVYEYNFFYNNEYDIQDELRHKKNKYKLLNKSRHLVVQEKEGYKTLTTPIVPTKLNPFIFVDIAVPLVSIPASFLGSSFFLMPASYSIFFGSWAPFYFGSFRVYNKQYTLPSLQPFPKHKAEENYISTGEVKFDVKPENMKRVYSSSMRTYIKNDVYSTNNTDSLSFISLTLNESINEKLNKYGYIETSNIFTQLENPYKLSLNISAITEVNAGNYYSIEVKLKWDLHYNYSSKPFFSFENTASSNWQFNNKRKFAELRHEQIDDAIELSLISFFNKNNIQGIIDKEIENYATQKANWEIIKIKGVDETSELDIANSLKAAVTVKLKDGHGSGFFISNDGYLITCFHVIGDKETNIEIITSDGVGHKGKLIRSNPYFDLALLKVDNIQSTQIKILNDKDIRIGSEVFAIGTPKDIRLGQTITKGIVSNIRKFKSRSFIQTDVSINKGNSGGALVTKNGDLLGIVNAKYTGYEIEGIGFAIPGFNIEDALKIEFE